ncbi:hypothetical protein [Paenibacillus sp. NPDC093718]|uniref:hypothetical protein n=1 Tax=Paenibacillus sp. NPDC093718 TaxID=3390601 RepID=UPI003D035415
MSIKERLKQHAKGAQSKSAGAPPPVKSPAAKEPSSQSWVPIKDIHNNIIYRKDNVIVSAVRVQPINIALLSENEQVRKIKQLEEVLNGIDYKNQTLSIAKPVDLDAYILGLEQMKQEADTALIARLLNGYIQQAASKATSGEALERHFYILIDQALSKKAQHEEQVLLQKALELANGLTHAELLSHVCNDNELRDLQFIFSNPNQAAYERAPLNSQSLPPVFFAAEGAYA